MKKWGFSLIEMIIIMLIIVFLAIVAVPLLGKCTKLRTTEICNDPLPPGYKLQTKEGKWRVASTKYDFQSSSTFDTRTEAAAFAWELYGKKYLTWKDESWTDECEPVIALKSYYEIYKRGNCYFWYDGGAGISQARFSSCEAALSNVKAYYQLRTAGDVDGVAALLTDGMHWPHQSEYRDYEKVKDGYVETSDCDCD